MKRTAAIILTLTTVCYLLSACGDNTIQAEPSSTAISDGSVAPTPTPESTPTPTPEPSEESITKESSEETPAVDEETLNSAITDFDGYKTDFANVTTLSDSIDLVHDIMCGNYGNVSLSGTDIDVRFYTDNNSTIVEENIQHDFDSLTIDYANCSWSALATYTRRMRPLDVAQSEYDYWSIIGYGTIGGDGKLRVGDNYNTNDPYIAGPLEEIPDYTGNPIPLKHAQFMTTTDFVEVCPSFFDMSFISADLLSQYDDRCSYDENKCLVTKGIPYTEFYDHLDVFEPILTTAGKSLDDVTDALVQFELQKYPDYGYVFSCKYKIQINFQSTPDYTLLICVQLPEIQPTDKLVSIPESFVSETGIYSLGD